MLFFLCFFTPTSVTPEMFALEWSTSTGMYIYGVWVCIWIIRSKTRNRVKCLNMFVAWDIALRGFAKPLSIRSFAKHLMYRRFVKLYNQDFPKSPTYVVLVRSPLYRIITDAHIYRGFVSPYVQGLHKALYMQELHHAPRGGSADKSQFYL